MPWALLAAACLGMFAASSSGTTRAPFLIEMARDLATSIPMVANLMAMTSISWGVASLFAGAGSDRWGRRPFLVGGPIGLALCMAGVAVSDGYAGIALAVTLAGACAGGLPGVIMAEAFVAMPFLVITVEGALRSADPRFEEAAATLGAGRDAIDLRLGKRVLDDINIPFCKAGLAVRQIKTPHALK